MRIYTKTGDRGETSNLNGQRVSKNDISIHLEGTLDELNSHLGLIKAMLPDEDARQFLEEKQKKLMKLMAHVSDNADSKYFFSGDEVEVLEREIDRLSENLPEKFQLVIPGKSIMEANIHIARTVARRAERLLAAVSEERALCQNSCAYLNRLSDYLFVLSQVTN
jgi:ATP:cob(I)alamin adenosyltransferase